MVTQTRTNRFSCHTEAHLELIQKFKLVQNVAAQKHSVAFLQLEGTNLFHIPSWILSCAPCAPAYIYSSWKSQPYLQGHATEQVLPLSLKGCIPWGLSSPEALWWLHVPLLFGSIPWKYFWSLNSFAASPAKSTLSQYVAHTKLLFSKLGSPYLGDRPNSNSKSNWENVISLRNI